MLGWHHVWWCEPPRDADSDCFKHPQKHMNQSHHWQDLVHRFDSIWTMSRPSPGETGAASSRESLAAFSLATIITCNACIHRRFAHCSVSRSGVHASVVANYRTTPRCNPAQTMLESSLHVHMYASPLRRLCCDSRLSLRGIAWHTKG